MAGLLPDLKLDLDLSRRPARGDAQGHAGFLFGPALIGGFAELASLRVAR